MGPRSYESDLRKLAKDQTRYAIIDALVDLILDEGVHAFTMPNVAKRASVSQRTVYRHFSSRELLLEALSNHADDLVNQTLQPPTHLEAEQIPGRIAQMYRQFDETGAPLRAAVVASIAMGHRTAQYEARQQRIYDFVAKTFPRLTAQEHREAGAVVRLLTGTRGWYVMTVEAGLDGDESGSGCAWALQALFDDLQRRNDDVSTDSDGE